MKTLAGVVTGVLLVAGLTACGGYVDPASKYNSRATCEAAGFEWDQDTRHVKKRVGTKTKRVAERYWRCESD
jgi:hypothetical protein